MKLFALGAAVLMCSSLSAWGATNVNIPASFPDGLNNGSVIWTDPVNSYLAGTSCYPSGCVPINISQKWGLRFDAPSGNYTLDSVLIAAGQPFNSSPGAPKATEFAIDLYAWSTALGEPVGPALFSSSQLNLPLPTNSLGFNVDALKIEMGAPLMSGAEYMLQFRGNGLLVVGTSQFGSKGNLVLFQTSDTPNMNIAHWQDFPMTVVSQFQLSAVPEPGTWAMLLFGFGGIGCILRMSGKSGRPILQQRI